MNINEYKNHIMSVGRFSKDKLSTKSNMVCVGIGGVGTLIFVINSLFLFGDNVKEIYVDMTGGWKNRCNIKINPYDYVLNQKIDNEFIKVFIWGHHLDNLKNINVLQNIRKNVNLLKFNENIIKTVEEKSKIMELDMNSLGVHIRLTDMNSVHGKRYGFIYYDDYIREIDAVLNNNNIKNIFISSDNHESIEKLKKRYKFNYIDNIHRTKYENQSLNHENRSIGYDNLTTIENFITPFYDVLLLSKCGYIIGRKYSCFRILSIILSKIEDENKIIELY